MPLADSQKWLSHWLLACRRGLVRLLVDVGRVLFLPRLRWEQFGQLILSEQ